MLHELKFQKSAQLTSSGHSSLRLTGPSGPGSPASQRCEHWQVRALNCSERTKKTSKTVQGAHCMLTRFSPVSIQYFVCLRILFLCAASVDVWTGTVGTRIPILDPLGFLDMTHLNPSRSQLLLITFLHHKNGYTSSNKFWNCHVWVTQLSLSHVCKP